MDKQTIPPATIKETIDAIQTKRNVTLYKDENPQRIKLKSDWKWKGQTV